MSDPVRLGFVGCGSVMQGSYVPLAEELAREGKAELVTAFDVNSQKMSQICERTGMRPAATAEDVIGADDVDLVLVLTSMPQHGPLTKAALEAGKHVLVEKPMAVTLEEAAELVTLARTSPGHLLPAPHVVLSPTYQTIWRRIHDGDIGKVCLARARYGWAGPRWGKWFYQQGGGSLFDLGVYNVVTLTGLLGPAQRVTGMVGVAISEREVEGEMMQVEADDNAHVLIDFGAARFAVVTTGFTMQKAQGPSIEFYGSEGTLHMRGYDWAPDGYELWRNSFGAWETHPETDRRWPWTAGLRHLVSCIQTGSQPLITPEHHYHVLEIMLKAQQAGKDGMAKEIESTFSPPTFGAEGAKVEAHLDHLTG